MRTWLVALATLCLCGPVFAKTIVVSDIDDTLKQSHILNRRDMVANSVLTDNPFLGMNGAIAALKMHQADTQYVYLSNAIDTLMRRLHTRFLAENKFPQGPLLLRRSPFDSQFKITELRKILNAEKPDLLILLGDNGERDPEIYEQLRQEFPQVAMRTYIHLVYSAQNKAETGAPLPAGQVGFATAFDLLSQWSVAGLVGPELIAKFYESFATLFLTEDPRTRQGPMTIPLWMDCRDLQWNAPVDPTPGSNVELVRQKIFTRCGLQPVLFNEEREYSFEHSL
jgi:hypothetical protein